MAFFRGPRVVKGSKNNSQIIIILHRPENNHRGIVCLTPVTEYYYDALLPFSYCVLGYAVSCVFCFSSNKASSLLRLCNLADSHRDRDISRLRHYGSQRPLTFNSPRVGLGQGVAQVFLRRQGGRVTLVIHVESTQRARVRPHSPQRLTFSK